MTFSKKNSCENFQFDRSHLTFGTTLPPFPFLFILRGKEMNLGVNSQKTIMLLDILYKIAQLSHKGQI